MIYRPIKEKYVSLSIHSTSQCKYWNKIGGWEKVVSYLNDKGYKVICVDQYPVFGAGKTMNIIPTNALDYTGKSFEEFTQLEADMGRARLGLAEKANEHLEQVVQNTSPQETSVRLSETAVMLTDSIRGILGIDAPQSRAEQLQDETNEILKVMARRTDAPAALTRQAQPAF